MSSQSNLSSPRRRFVFASLILFTLVSFTGLGAPAWAGALDDLRAAGKVGEAYDGYARARDSSVQGTVDGVNAKRRAIYTKRASEQGISAAQVGSVYANKIIAQSPNGTWILEQNGSWRQK
jgi:uncharacterized protein YdbL (DUF1318 family)